MLVMHRLTAVLLLLLVSVSVVQAQTPDWKAELGEDIVQIRGDKMMMEEYALLKLNVEGQKTNNLQVKLYAEAPKDGIISRDNFVNLTSMITYMSLLEIYARAYQLSASEYLQAVDIEQIPNPIGTPDIELNLTATNAGLQIEFVNTADNQRRRVTRTWEEMYAE
ncbi:hypothetical protein CRI94_04425 [Longibacter salinarum]|uniref:Uncharacterized protein n=1 Tax=Longibacter salinarum TaxID=1850348 RepID=A0A2A8D094_9BACT|nr:hypothetical protein CRI94_04425 [Longibacter salinarum]